MTKMSMQFAFLALAALTLAACKPAELPTEPVLENAWIRSMPPGMKMTAGFGTLTNGTADKIEIRSFSSAQFRDVSLHRTELVDGVSHMREVENLSLCTDEALVMEPGGYHLMLMGPMANIMPGQVVDIEVTAADGRVFSYRVPVEKR